MTDVSGCRNETLKETPRTEECAVCGEEVEIGGFPPTYYYPLDQSDVPNHKVNMVPNPQDEFACEYNCLRKYELEKEVNEA